MRDIEYEFLDSFEFKSSDDISKRKYVVHKEGSDKAYFRIERKLRRKPLTGMRQPIPHGAIMGWDAEIEVKNKGKTADGHILKLYKSGELVQDTRTDEQGRASLSMDFEAANYKLEIYSPIYACNIEPEE